MVQKKLKTCAGFDGKEHQAYIYKNINGKKYCKSCTFKLEGNDKPVFKVHVIKKVSDKQRLKNEQKKLLVEEDKKFYLDIWKKRFSFEYQGMELYHTWPECQCCKEKLGNEPNLLYFHHILEKRNFPELRHVEWNIAILCPQCHNRYETNPDNIPYLKELREEKLNYYNSIKSNKDEEQSRGEGSSKWNSEDVTREGSECD